MDRTFNFDILPLIKTRFSARAISPEKIPREEILSLVEAARYAPSCFNEQPWRFVIADDDESLARLRVSLSEGNKPWAGRAPVLIAVCAKKNFAANNSENFYRQFDTGTAWGYFSLEGERRGYYTHGMAGFDKKSAAEAIDLPADHEIIALVAVGKPGNPDDLSEAVRAREKPNTRKDLSEISFFGKFGKS